MAAPATHDAASLQSTSASMGCALSADAAERLLAYLALLQRWNRVHNLTALRDPAAMWTHHLLDSLSIISPIDRWAGARGPAGGGEGSGLTLVDVGSGGGLPGVVLAVARPEWRVMTVDAVAKKAGFVRQVGIELGLRNLDARHARVEQLPPAGADLIVSRAFASLADFCRLTQVHLAARGSAWAAMKGRRPDDEIAALPAGIDVFHVEPLEVPGLDAERHLVWMRPAESALRSTSAADASAAP